MSVNSFGLDCEDGCEAGTPNLRDARAPLPTAPTPAP